MTVPHNQHQSALVGRAMKDPVFRAQLIANPVTSIEQALGVELPAGVQVKVLEESSDTIYVILPTPVTLPTQESPDLGLEEVAGFASANTHVGCGNCSVTAPQTSRPCGCR